MRILISNDDGIQARGLIELKKALDSIGIVTVVAPDRERSAAGHGITTHKPLRPKEYQFADGSMGWSVNGTPADCVKLALDALLDEQPDLVVSGINRGANLGTDVLYSGTVSAAIEGTINGIPSVAISLASYESDDFSYAANFAASFIPLLVNANGQGKAVLLTNINVPPGKPNGVKTTRLGTRRYVNIFHKRVDPRGQVYYWMAGKPEDSAPPIPGLVNMDVKSINVDINAVKNNHISITPLHFDLTDFNLIYQMELILSGLHS